jgi:glycosyltransferase involved in cell wall biosynthesis
MRILVVCHYFPPEVGAPQARLSGLARWWASEGHTVTVLTGMPNHPTGIVDAEYRGRWRMQELVDGYRVVRTWLYATPNEKILRKTIGHLSFMVSSVLLGSTLTGPIDVVVVSSPTFFSILSAWVIARVRRAALVVEVRDLWPAIFVELGVLTSRRLIWVLERAELAAYRAATKIVVVSAGFRDHLIALGVPPDKIYVVRNGVDIDRFHTSVRSSDQARAQLGATPGSILVLYIGAHGISQGLSTLVDAAAQLGPGVHLALVGEGASKALIQAQVAAAELRNVTMLGNVPHSEVPALLAAADICLVPLRDVPLFSTFIPSKLFECLAVGKPVIGSVRGEAAAILSAAGAVVIEPEKPDLLAAAIQELASDPERRRSMGVAGRCYVRHNFDRRKLAFIYLEVLDDAIETRTNRETAATG